MADAMIDLELAGGLGLPYEPGAEASLAPGDAAAFAAVSTTAGVPLTLVPLFGGPVAELADFLAAARQGGVEPPDLFACYSLACPPDVADAVVAALQALPFVVQAAVRPVVVPAGWQVVTDPDAFWQKYLRPYIDGVDAFAAWQVPGGDGRGVRVADVESFWDLEHPDLKPAGVTALQFLPQPVTAEDRKDRDHGTASLGIVGARSTGTGLTGIAPGAALAASPASADGTAVAIRRAASHVGRGGVVLLELGIALTPGCQRNGPPFCTGDIALELHWADRQAILAATALGALVIEPAGNGKIDFDTDPRTASLRGFDPAGVDSGALIVAAGERQLNAEGRPTGPWMAADFTSGGLRASCFAAGKEVAASGPGDVQWVNTFDGTSSASAILAGVAAAVQGVALASTGRRLDGNALRAVLADPQNGHYPGAPSPVNPVAIGVMPDLAWLVEALGVPRLPPATAIRSAGSVVLVRARRGNINQLDILEWREATASWAWSLTSGEDPHIQTIGHAVALHAGLHPAGLVIDVVCPTELGAVAHRPVRPDIGLGFDQPWRSVSEPGSEAENFRITTPFTAVSNSGRLLVSGLSPTGTARVFIAERKPGSIEVFPMTPDFPGQHEPTFVTLDPFVRFNAAPVIYDADGSVVLVGVDTTGAMWVAGWTLDTGWSALTSVASGFDPAQAPALAHDGPALHVIGVDPSSRELREIVRSPDADSLFQWSAMRSIAQPPLVTWGVPLAPEGALAAATDGGGTLVAIALTAAGLPVATQRPAGLDWSPLFFVPTLTSFVARAGLAIASPSPGVFIAFASDARGALHAARWTVLGWAPFAPV